MTKNFHRKYTYIFVLQLYIYIRKRQKSSLNNLPDKRCIKTKPMDSSVQCGTNHIPDKPNIEYDKLHAVKHNYDQKLDIKPDNKILSPLNHIATYVYKPCILSDLNH